MSSIFEVLLLGTNSALPMHGRNPSGQYLQFSDKHFLIDCGEGTQHRLDAYNVKRSKIDRIFISHLHGDHVYGLPGLLGSYNHYSRNKKLYVYGPPPIKHFLHSIFSMTEARFGFEMEIIEIDPDKSSKIVINEEISITSFPLKHRIPTIGYRFDFVPKKRNIQKEKIKHLGLSIAQIKKLVLGEDVILENGQLLKNREFTFIKSEPKSYAYCSDTIYDEEIIPNILGVDLLYHETTYLDGLEKEAEERMHSTLGQAIKISKLARVKKLLTGHYSSRYNNLSEFRKMADNSTLEVIVGIDGNTYKF